MLRTTTVQHHYYYRGVRWYNALSNNQLKLRKHMNMNNLKIKSFSLTNHHAVFLQG